MSAATLKELRNQVELLKGERELRKARGVSVPEWFDSIILIVERDLQDAEAAAGQDIGDEMQNLSPFPWYGWAGLLAGACLLVALFLWRFA